MSPNRCLTHKYRRFKGKNVYHCVNCPSYITGDYIIGHKSVCWKCGQEFTISDFKYLKMKPVCKNCMGEKGTIPVKSNSAVEELKELLLKKTGSI